MKELLTNDAVQTAIILVIVTALNAAVAWIKAKFPSQTAIVESHWCYLQPAVELAMKAAKEYAEKSALGGGVIVGIAQEALEKFSEDYRKFENAEPTEAVISAARSEIAAAIDKVASESGAK